MRDSVINMIVALVLLFLGIHQLLLCIGADGVYVTLASGMLAASALASSFGVWRSADWAPWSLIVLGILFAAVQLTEAFILGIQPWGIALFLAIASIVAAVLLSMWISAIANPGDDRPEPIVGSE